MIGKVIVKMLKGEKGDTGASGDYAELTNKPSINGVEVGGDQTGSYYGLASEAEQDNLIDSVVGINNRVDGIAADLTTINSNLAPLTERKTGTITAATGFTVNSGFDNSVRQIGNTVCLFLVINANAGYVFSPSGGTVATISGVSLPTMENLCLCEVRDEDNEPSVASVSVGSGGTVSVRVFDNTTAKKQARIYLSYTV